MNRRFSSDRFSDFPIHVLLAVIFLSGIGILALYSIALNQPGTWYSHSYAKQLLFLILALSFTFLIYLIPLSRIYNVCLLVVQFVDHSDLYSVFPPISGRNTSLDHLWRNTISALGVC